MILFGNHLGWFDLPNPIGRWEGLAMLARVVHILLAYAAVVLIAWPIGLGLKHQIFDRDRFLNRMWPFSQR